MLTVFGSINIDQVIRVPSLPGPGETTLGERVMDTHGGKGANQAVAAARASGGTTPVTMIGSLGRDQPGQHALQNLQDNGVLTECQQHADCLTGTAIITVSQDGENTITVIAGANDQLLARDVSKQVLARTSTLLCQGEVSLLETCRAITTYKDSVPNGIVVMNLAPVPQIGDMDTLRKVLGNTDILIVNEHEAQSLLRLLVHPDSASLLPIATQFELQILITRGPDGAELLDKSGINLRVPSPSVEPVDTTGAGDTFCGAFAVLITEGWPIETAMRAACTAAANACCTIGAQTGMPFRNEILKGAVRRGYNVEPWQLRRCTD